MKRGPVARIILYLFFAGLIVVPLVLTRRSPRSAASPSHASNDAALARYGFYLAENSKQAGVNFIHQAPVLDSQLAPIMPEVASMGASVSIVDFDRDGWPDFYVTNSR